MVVRSEFWCISSDSARNAEATRALVTKLHDKSGRRWAAAKTPRSRHASRGKMLARQRVDLLNSTTELHSRTVATAAHGMYGCDVHSAKHHHRTVPPEILALEFKGEFRQSAICSVSTTIDIG